MDRRNLERGSPGWLGRLLRSPRQLRDDVRAELAFHVEGRTKELVEAGWDENTARAEALRAFGDLQSIEAECVQVGLERIHRQRRTQAMADLVSDLRYALRSFRRNPVFALVAVVTLGIGMGAATAVFTVVDRVALRDLPLLEPEQLFVVWETNPSRGIALDNPSGRTLYDWGERTESFAGLAGWIPESITLTGFERAEVLDIAQVTANLFPTLGIAPQMGRMFTEAEESFEGARTVLLGHEYWQSRFAGRAMIGESLTLNGVPYEVIGVMPQGLEYPMPDVDAWIPAPLADPDEHRTSRYMNVIARLGDGVSLERAHRDINRVHAELAVEDPDAMAGYQVALVRAKEQVVGDTGRRASVVLVAVGLVLLISCTNVANLLLGRTASRERELEIRGAIGASPGRIRRQLLTESVTLGLLGGIVGLFVAHGVLEFFLALEPALPRAGEVRIDGRIVGSVVLGAIACSVLFGLMPSAHGLKARIGAPQAVRNLRSANRTRRVLVTAELALSVVLLVSAGMFTLSFMSLLNVDPGFDREGVIAAKVDLNNTTYSTSDARRQYFAQLKARLEEVPGVAQAAVTMALPMDPSGTDFDLARQPEGHPVLPEAEAPQTDYRVVSVGYFDAMGMSLSEGRDFSSFDRVDTQPVLIITESMAEGLWPGESAIGKQITIHYIQDRPWEVVGVVTDTRHRGLATPPSHQMFVSVNQAEYLLGYMTVVVRSRQAGGPSLEALRDAALRVDPNQPLFEITTVEEVVHASVARDRLITWSVGSLALLALLLAASGVYAVVSYQVTRRTREIGVRMALGAKRGRVMREVLTDALGLAVFGLVLGLALSVVVARVAQSLIFGAVTWNPVILLGVPLTLLGVTALAAVAPAFRAAGVDPAHAMRTE